MTDKQYQRAKAISNIQRDIIRVLEDVKKREAVMPILPDYPLTKDADDQIRKIMIADLGNQLSDLKKQFEQI